jgi:hypothetical protein
VNVATHIDEVEGPPDAADDLRAVGAQYRGRERPPPAQQLPPDRCAHAASVLGQQRYCLPCSSSWSVGSPHVWTSCASTFVSTRDDGYAMRVWQVMFRGGAFDQTSSCSSRRNLLTGTRHNPAGLTFLVHDRVLVALLKPKNDCAPAH